MIGRSLADQTKWQVTIMLGGPSPCLGGKLTTLMSVHISTHLYHNLLLVRSHFGTTPDGKSFDEYLGEESYHQHIETTFDNFLHASFSKFVDTMYIVITYFNSVPGAEECNDRSLYSASKESTPEGDKMETDEDIGEGENEGDKGKGKIKESEINTAHPISQYELERERNIARNKEALKRADDDLREKYGDVCFESSKTKTKTPHMKKEASEGQRHISARLNVAGQR